MSRPGPSVAVPNLNLSARPPRPPLLEVTLQVVTPMFGGSASPGVVDSDHPVRASSVRGHLRFWWRACNAHRYSSITRLFDDESRLWGQTHREGQRVATSPVDVEVELDPNSTGEVIDCVMWSCSERPQRKRDSWRPKWGAFPKWGDFPAYALFPFQGEAPDRCAPQNTWDVPPAKALIGTRFTVHLAQSPYARTLTEEDWDGVRAALWAWITFGGVGARTRRGCGALWADDQSLSLSVPDQSNEPARSAIAGLQARKSLHVHGDPISKHIPLPVLAGAQVILRPIVQKTMPSWCEAVGAMQTYRQGEGIGRDSGSDPKVPLKLGQSF